MAKYDIFISYSRKDTPVAERICKALDNAGITYFIDRQSVGGGMEVPIALADAICDSTLFLFLASENAYKSKFTNSEVTFAFNEKNKQSILPYIIDNSELPRHFRFIFSSINWRNLAQHPIETVLIDDLCSMLGKSKIKITQSEEAEQWFQTGEKYYHGKGIEKNYEEAVKWYRMAAEKGLAEAQNNLGIMYRYGHGVEKNYEEAVKWYRMAAEQGLAEAQNNLGIMYTYGYGVEKNYEEAVKWYRMAAEQGYAESMQRLKNWYQKKYNKVRSQFKKLFDN